MAKSISDWGHLQNALGNHNGPALAAQQQAYNAGVYGTDLSTVGWDTATTGTTATTNVHSIDYDQYLRLTIGHSNKRCV